LCSRFFENAPREAEIFRILAGAQRRVKR